MKGEWQPIETAPHRTAVWVATEYSGHGTGQMEPAMRHFGEWQNIYSGSPLAWQPTHWSALPRPPEQTVNVKTNAKTG